MNRRDAIRTIVGAEPSKDSGESGMGSIIVVGIITLGVFTIIPAMNGTNVIKAWRETR